MLKGTNKFGFIDLLTSIGYYEKDELVGYCDLHIADENTLMITNLKVIKKYQKQGHGTKMVAEVIQLYKEQFAEFYPRLILRVLHHNTPALKVYLKNGFEIYNVEEPYGDEYVLRMELRK